MTMLSLYPLDPRCCLLSKGSVKGDERCPQINAD